MRLWRELLYNSKPLTFDFTLYTRYIPLYVHLNPHVSVCLLRMLGHHQPPRDTSLGGGTLVEIQGYTSNVVCAIRRISRQPA